MSTRWGSHLGLPPLYFSDILVAGAVFFLIVGSRIAPKTRFHKIQDPFSLQLLLVFLTYVFFRALFSLEPGSVTVWARDLAPYLYGILAFVSAYSVTHANKATRELTHSVLHGALVAHAIWIVFTNLTQTRFSVGTAVPIFAIRPDIDLALLGVLGAVSLRKFLINEKRKINFMGLILVLFAFASWLPTTRSGFLSFIVVILLAIVLSKTVAPRDEGATVSRVFVITSVGLVLGWFFAVSDAGLRILKSLFPATTFVGIDSDTGEGTQQARENSWAELLRWVQDDSVRLFFGSGFGNHFMSDSGALALLIGPEELEVRSPHNWFLNTLARLGIVGLFLAGFWLFRVIRGIVDNRLLVALDSLSFMSAIVFVAIIPVAAFGVVLESPFGAIPFFWFAGILIAGANFGDTVKTIELQGPLTVQGVD